MALIIRGGTIFARLLLSRHPLDSLTWLRSFRARRRPLTIAVPWLTFNATRAITGRLPSGSRVFEYGAGHSTLYWLNLGAEVVSVEHEAQWYEALAGKLAGGQNRVTLIHETDEKAYVDVIHRYAYDYFDMVLIDGIARRACVHAAIRHVRPGGILVLDNTDFHWVRENPIEGIPEHWPRFVYPGYAPMLGHSSETTVWVRPSEEEVKS